MIGFLLWAEAGDTETSAMWIWMHDSMENFLPFYNSNIFPPKHAFLGDGRGQDSFLTL